MPYSGDDFMEFAAPIGDFFQGVNQGYRLAYEFDRDDYHPDVAEEWGRSGASREEFGIDLSRVDCINSTWKEDLEDIQYHVLYHVTQNSLDNSSKLDSFFGT